MQALAGSCKTTHEDRVRSAVECVLAGETTVLVLTGALETSVPPSLERLGRLVDLRVLDLPGNNLERVPDYIGEMRSLEVLGFCDNRLTEVPESLGRLSKLRRLVLSSNRLTRLPSRLSTCTIWRRFSFNANQLTALPAWLAALPKLQTLRADNPLQLPPRSMCDGTNNCLADVRRYFASLAKHGATTSRRVKLVLAGAGLAGKTSTLRGLQRDCAPSPADKDARTVQLDIWTLVLGDVVVSAWDFAGQPEYAAAQQAYLVDGALYLLLVPAHRAMDEDAYPDVLGRWLNTLQARAPGAVVQVVLSHGDEVAAPGLLVEAWPAWLAEGSGEEGAAAAQGGRARRDCGRASLGVSFSQSTLARRARWWKWTMVTCLSRSSSPTGRTGGSERSTWPLRCKARRGGPSTRSARSRRGSRAGTSRRAGGGGGGGAGRRLKRRLTGLQTPRRGGEARK